MGQRRRRAGGVSGLRRTGELHLERSHSASTANQIGDLWSFSYQNASVRRAKRDFIRDDFLLPDSWQGEDLFCAQGVGYSTPQNPRAIG